MGENEGGEFLSLFQEKEQIEIISKSENPIALRYISSIDPNPLLSLLRTFLKTRFMNRDRSFRRRRGNTDWTSVIVQSLLRQIERNTCILRHLPLYDFSNIGLF